MDMLVPRGQPSDTFSESQAVFWKVRSVPESSATDMREKREKTGTKLVRLAISCVMKRN